MRTKGTPLALNVSALLFIAVMLRHGMLKRKNSVMFIMLYILFSIS